MIAAFGNSAAVAAKAATTTIPIVFSVGDDPVRLGLVASLAQPGGNLTGINNFATELAAKRLELLREMVPAATRVAVLVSPSNAATSESTVRDTAAGARAMGLQVQVLNADTSREIDAAFARLARERSDALFVDPNPFFLSRRAQLVNLASRLAVPAIYFDRAFAEIGGLMSYGASLRMRIARSASIPRASSRAPSPPTCRSCSRRSSSWSSTLRPPRMLGLTVPPTLLATRRRGDRMRRREFITLLGGAAAAWPLAARAQQPAMPVIGFLRSTPATGFAYIVDPFRQGLNDAGFVEGKNVAIEYRWADNQQDRLPGLAADLMRRQVAAIVGAGVPAAQAGKAATATTPIVFVIGADPVRVGLVASINRPGGNITGVVFSVEALVAKLLGMLHELVPKASIIAVLRDPNGPDVERQSRDLEEAARAIGRQILMVNAANEREFHAAFAKVVQAGAGGLLISSTVFFNSQRRQLVALAARHALPTVYSQREYAEVGGLISYGPSQSDAYRRAGVYVGRILKGEKPGDLPVELGTKFELVINLATAKAFGVEIPPTLLAIADEVIE